MTTSKIYHFFLDETGDHGLSFIDKNFPIFLLAGCLFEDYEYLKTTKELNMLKNDIFGTTEVIFHSRDIRKCEGAFQILFDLELKKRFYEKLNKILLNSKFKIISVAIDKRKHIERYGKIAGNPYTICLSYILERLIFCTESRESSKNTVSISIEKRGLKEDRQLLAHYNGVIDMGTYHVDRSRFSQRIVDFKMTSKKENNIGLQIADLCAYPLARHILNNKEPYIPFQIIQNKIYRSSKTGKIEGYGLKIFP